MVPTDIAAGYAWNSVIIDGTDILRSIPTIGREIHFPIDVSLNTLPKLTQNNGQTALDYLKITDSSRHFSSSLLNMLIEDHRIARIECINNNRNLIGLAAGDIVMARTSIQRDQNKKKVPKLWYAAQDPCQIIRTTGRGSYFVIKLYMPDSPEFEFILFSHLLNLVRLLTQ